MDERLVAAGTFEGEFSNVTTQLRRQGRAALSVVTRRQVRNVVGTQAVQTGVQHPGQHRALRHPKHAAGPHTCDDANFCFTSLERFRAKWTPVRVKKTRQNKNLEPGSDSIRTEKAPVELRLWANSGHAVCWPLRRVDRAPRMTLPICLTQIFRRNRNAAHKTSRIKIEFCAATRSILKTSRNNGVPESPSFRRRDTRPPGFAPFENEGALFLFLSLGSARTVTRPPFPARGNHTLRRWS